MIKNIINIEFKQINFIYNLISEKFNNNFILMLKFRNVTNIIDLYIIFHLNGMIIIKFLFS